MMQNSSPPQQPPKIILTLPSSPSFHNDESHKSDPSFSVVESSEATTGPHLKTYAVESKLRPSILLLEEETKKTSEKDGVRRPPSEGLHWWPILLFFLCFLPLIAVVALFLILKVGVDSDAIGGFSGADSSKENLGIKEIPGLMRLVECKEEEILINGYCTISPCKVGQFYSIKSQRCEVCPPLPTIGKLMTFWPSSDPYCDDVPEMVDVVNLGTLRIREDGSLNPTFQTNSTKDVKRCIRHWHNQCMRVLVNIGGDTLFPTSVSVSSLSLLRTSAAEILTELQADGVNIVDQRSGENFQPLQLIESARALRSILPREESFFLSYEATAFEADEKICKDPPSSRCFPIGIEQYLNWVNFNYFNVARDPAAAESIYQDAMKRHFSLFSAKAGDPTKVNIGTCVGLGCALGPPPSDQVVVAWASQARVFLGGMNVVSAVSDREKDFRVIKLVNQVLGRTKPYSSSPDKQLRIRR